MLSSFSKAERTDDPSIPVEQVSRTRPSGRGVLSDGLGTTFCLSLQTAIEGLVAVHVHLCQTTAHQERVIVNGRQHAVVRVFAFWAIEQFDVFKYVPSGLLACQIFASPDLFSFQELKEALSNRVVVSIAPAARRLLP